MGINVGRWRRWLAFVLIALGIIMALTFESTRESYASLLKRVQINPSWQGGYDRAAGYILNHRARYEGAARRMGNGIPWQLIACLHWREASGSFAGVLHNGEKILGTGRRTRLEPKNRGPFNTWEEAAADAIKIKSKTVPPEWSLEGVAWFAENFNGLGYRRYHPSVNSPYLWAGTNVYVRGKYVSDGSYDSSHVDKQLGVMPLYQMLLDKTERREIREESGKVSLMGTVRGWIKAAGAAVASLFSLDTLGYLKDVHAQLEGVFDAKTVAVLLAAGGLTWLLINVLERKTVEDGLAGSYTPSGMSDDEPGKLTDGEHNVEHDKLAA